jgi:hypothetical protein
MATVTGLTADRMLEIEAASVIDGDVIDGELILTKHDGSTIDAGSVIFLFLFNRLFSILVCRIKFVQVEC